MLKDAILFITKKINIFKCLLTFGNSKTLCDNKNLKEIFITSECEIRPNQLMVAGDLKRRFQVLNQTA